MKQMDNSCGSVAMLPQGVFSLFFIQIFSTLSFSVLYSTLVLYMTGQLKFSPIIANNITGVFVAFNFALHLLGGYMGGRFISNRALFSLGMLMQVIGCVLLSRLSVDFLYLGLGFFLAGSGLNVTCINCMLTQRFEPQDTRRETAFLWNYAGMNIGFFVGFSLSGYFQLFHQYQRLFLLSSLGNLVALFLCLYFWQPLKDRDTKLSQLTGSDKRRAIYKGFFIVLILPFVLSQLVNFADLANRLVLVIGGIIFLVVCTIAMNEPSKKAKEKMMAFAILMLVGTVFWMLYQIGPMGLTQFIEHNVDRHWLGMTIAPQWFQNINTLCIVLGGPLMSVVFIKMRAHGINVNIPTQFTLALLLIGLAFVLLPLGIEHANIYGFVAPGWVVFSFILQSLGELLISPIGYAMVGALAPVRLQGVMMGMWMLTSGVGATLSSYSSNWMVEGQSSTLPLTTNAGYAHVFLQLGVIAIVASVVLAVMIPKLRKYMEADKSCNQEKIELAIV